MYLEDNDWRTKARGDAWRAQVADAGSSRTVAGCNSGRLYAQCWDMWHQRLGSSRWWRTGWRLDCLAKTMVCCRDEIACFIIKGESGWWTPIWSREWRLENMNLPTASWPWSPFVSILPTCIDSMYCYPKQEKPWTSLTQTLRGISAFSVRQKLTAKHHYSPVYLYGKKCRDEPHLWLPRNSLSDWCIRPIPNPEMIMAHTPKRQSTVMPDSWKATTFLVAKNISQPNCPIRLKVKVVLQKCYPKSSPSYLIPSVSQPQKPIIPAQHETPKSPSIIAATHHHSSLTLTNFVIFIPSLSTSTSSSTL